MRSLVVVASLLVVGLAGCSSSPDPPGAQASSSSSPPSILVFEEPPPKTDRLYLLDAPHLAGTLPANGPEYRTPLPSGLDTSQETLLWTLPRPQLDVFHVTASLWVDVQGTHANHGAPTGACFWVIILRVESDNGFSGWASECPAQEAAIVAPGIRELQVTFPVMDVGDVEGDEVSLWITAGSDTESPGSTIELLTGSAEHPSWMAIEDLQLPLDTRTYL